MGRAQFRECRITAIFDRDSEAACAAQGSHRNACAARFSEDARGVLGSNRKQIARLIFAEEKRNGLSASR